ncbi:MAG: EAL domain-containing protein [Oscillospiraceae bacterium]
MGIFQFTRQNHVNLSEDWKLFADLFHNIGAFTYKETLQTVYFDENAQRILNVGKSMPKNEYKIFLGKLMETPVEGEQNLYLLRSGAEKRYLKLLLTKREGEELGFVEDVTRRIVQLNAGQQEYDDVTGMLQMSAFSNIINQKIQENETFILTAVYISGLDKMTDFSALVSTNNCMASVAEVLGRFASEQVVFTVKDFQKFYIGFFHMDEQNARVQLQQMREAVSKCIISDDFGQAIQTEHGHILDMQAGLALFPDEGDSFRGLMTHAEFALFETQHDAQNPITRFSKSEFERKKDEYREEQLFQTIIHENQLHYHFQPIVDAHNGNIVGYEALMRSEHFIPDKILEIAERLGQLYKIEYATLFNTMHFLAEHQSSFSDKSLFINCIPDNILNDADFNELLLLYEELFGKVVIEIIEQLEGSDKMMKTLRERCQSVKARLAIDDYGSGYANTATLLHNMPNYVKIDMELIQGICKNTKKQQLVASIIDYAHENQMFALAEGVEEEADVKMLIRMGIDLFQGFYFARPTPYLLEEISKEVRDVIINTNLEETTGQKKIYNAHQDAELNLVDLALQNYTDIHVYRHQLTLIGDPEKQVPMHIAIMDNHSCELTFQNVNIICQDKPTIEIGTYAHLTLIAEGENQINCMGIRVPEGAFFHLLGDGNLKVDSYSKFGYGIGGDCDSSYGNITLESNGNVEIICNSDRGVGIGGGSNPDDSEICLEAGKIHVVVGSPNALGIGAIDGASGDSLIYANPNCKLDIEVNGIGSVGMGALFGGVHVKCFSDVKFNGGGNKVVGIGALNKGTGIVEVGDSQLNFFMRTNFGACIGAIGGEVDVIVTNCKIEVDAEGGEITGVGDSKGSGDVTLDHTELKAYILAAKPHEAGSKNGQFTMHSSTIIADINDKHNTTGE